MAVKSWLNKFESNQVFTEDEAWMLFKIAAFSEAIGWTILIIGIVISTYIDPSTKIPLLLAGRTHGMLFFAYALAAISLYPNLKWSRTKSFIALLASVPPYGSLMFEIWANSVRSNQRLQTYSKLIYIFQVINNLD